MNSINALKKEVKKVLLIGRDIKKREKDISIRLILNDTVKQLESALDALEDIDTSTMGNESVRP